MTPLQQLKDANEKYFAKGQKRFFGDINYRVLYGKKSAKPFLVTYTNGWTDMFDGIKKPFYVIKTIRDDWKIGEFITEEGSSMYRQFRDIYAVKEWLKGH